MSFTDKKMTHPKDAAMFAPREGEISLPLDPAALKGDGHVVFIGRIHSPWTSREECPKNMGAARATGKSASVAIDEIYRPGLEGLGRASHVVILSWLEHAPRNLILQKPRHATVASGVFALRSPARPNPIGLHVARLISMDIASGKLEIDAIDALDGTPIVDLKPYLPSVDLLPDAIHAKTAE